MLRRDVDARHGIIRGLRTVLVLNIEESSVKWYGGQLSTPPPLHSICASSLRVVQNGIARGYLILPQPFAFLT